MKMKIELGGEVIELSKVATAILRAEARKRGLSMLDALQEIVMEQLGQESLVE